MKLASSKKTESDGKFEEGAKSIFDNQKLRNQGKK